MGQDSCASSSDRLERRGSTIARATTTWMGWTTEYKTRFAYNTLGRRGTSLQAKPTNSIPNLPPLTQMGMSCKTKTKTTRHLIGARLESPASSASAPTPPPAIAPPTSAPASLVLLSVLRFWCIVHQERVEGEGVGEDEIADVVAADGEGVERSGVAVARGHFDGLQVRIHLHVDPYNTTSSISASGGLNA